MLKIGGSCLQSFLGPGSFLLQRCLQLLELLLQVVRAGLRSGQRVRMLRSTAQLLPQLLRLSSPLCCISLHGHSICLAQHMTI